MQSLIDHAQLVNQGFCFARGLLDSPSIARLINVVEASTKTEDGRGGVRNLLDVPEFRELAESAVLKEVVAAALGDNAFIVRGILFDKTDSANWKVPWHQDVTIAVTDRVDVEDTGRGP